LWLDGSVVEKYRNIVTSCYTKSGIGHFTVVCLVTWPWMQARLEVTLL